MTLMTTRLHGHPARQRETPTTTGSRARPSTYVWPVLFLLAVLLPVAGVVVAALTGMALWLVPAAVVAGLVAVALSVFT